jgi:hypothetical protein
MAHRAKLLIVKPLSFLCVVFRQDRPAEQAATMCNGRTNFAADFRSISSRYPKPCFGLPRVKKQVTARPNAVRSYPGKKSPDRWTITPALQTALFEDCQTTGLAATIPDSQASPAPVLLTPFEAQPAAGAGLADGPAGDPHVRNAH